MFGKYTRVLVAPALFLLLTACGGGGSGTSAVPRTGNSSVQGASAAPVAATVARTSASASNGALFVPNETKYSDAGAKPATGRSGSAVIASRALLAKDGTTLVEATTGVLDAQPGAGSISKVQAKLRSIDGVERQALNYNHLSGNGYWNHTYSGLARNDTVQVLSHVDGLDANRTDVVTTLDTVKLRPDLAALRLSGPARAYVHAPVTFTATVAELNGDVGARANCVLSADGQQVDQALGIWVDAGHTVSCAFQTTFATTGTKHLTVAVTNVVPADWDLANNTAQTTIEIVDPIVQLGYYVNASNGIYNNDWYYRFDGPWYGYSYGDHYTQTYSNATIVGRTTKHVFQFPIQQLSGNVIADGTTVAQTTLSTLSPPYDFGYGKCSYRYAPGIYTHVCGFNWGYSEAVVQFYGGAVTYYSYYAGYYCGYWGCSGYSYISNNYSYNYGLPAFDIGSNDQFKLSLTDASGTIYRATTPVLPTTPYNYANSWNSCYNYYGYNYCYGNSYSNTGKYVAAETPWGAF